MALPRLDYTVMQKSEIWWRDHQSWLEKQGYLLRPRYLPNWKPSWLDDNGSRKDPNKPIFFYEDGQLLRRGFTICDATRISDQSRVSLKLVHPSEHPFEADIGKYLSSLPEDVRNHCVPILEILEVPTEEDLVVIVMPLLRSWSSPPLHTVGEVVDLFNQLVEGLQFMHEHNIAHRDISVLNVMMDGSMFPDGWHPCNDDQDPSLTKDARCYSRLRRPPKYYLIDFGISRRYEPGHGPILEPPIHGGDKSVPEFATSAPCDPFATDIYYLGNFIREGLLKDFNGCDFIKPLITDMVQDDPSKRPTIDEVATRFGAMRKKMGLLMLRSRLAPKDERFGSIRFLTHFFKSLGNTLLGVHAIPTRSK